METIYSIKKLSPAQKMVLGNIYNRSKINGYCYPSIRQLADELGLAVDTVVRSIKLLKKLGYINVIARYNTNYNSNGGRQSNIYELTAEFRQKLTQKGAVKKNGG